MPKCSRCGSYFIRSPCPVCSPPGVKQIIEDAPKAKGKSIDEFQGELEILQEKLKSLGLEYETRIQEIKTNLETINNRISDLEISKVSSDENKRSLEEQYSNLNKELELLINSKKPLEIERNALLEDIRTAKQNIQRLDSEISNLKEKREYLQQQEHQKEKESLEQKEEPDDTSEDFQEDP